MVEDADYERALEILRPYYEQGPPTASAWTCPACGELLEGATLGFREGFDRTELEDTLVEYAACMRENGYDMPDPDFSGSGAGPGAGPGGGALSLAAGFDEDP